MESGPFSRRAWGTQSLRITAKELSLVSGRGKNTAIAERFSKYQRAAEESSAEKKKGALDGTTSSLRSGNLSALKKRWEQAQKADDSNSSSGPLERQTSFRSSRPPVLTRLPSITESTASVKAPAPAPKTAQGVPSAAARAPTFSAAPEESAPEEERAMDRNEVTHRQKPEMLEEQVPTSPRAFYEKPRVPLNNLKMRFEKGEEATGKVGRTTLRSSSSDDADQRSGPTVSDRALESSSLREKMAKYQAAVSKHGPAQTGVAPETPAPKSPECNGETSEPLKTTKKFSAPVRETCFSCSKTVYPLERLMAQQHVYHKNCFKCDYCSTRLSLGNFASLHGNIYCKPHYSQLFKTKGNYDEGFGHRPHKELWEPRVEGEECGEEPVKTKEPEQLERATRPTEGGSDTQAVETSSQLKVTDVTALLETRAQTQSSATEKPSETRRLRIAWPPPADEGQSGAGPLSPLAEDMPSIRPGRAKWPPDDEAPSAFQSSERAELKSLRRSSSLKERSRPFTIAVKTEPAPTLGPRERRRPLKSLLEWRASFEERHPSDDSAKENKAEQQEENKKAARANGDAAEVKETISEEERGTVAQEQQEETHEQGNKGKDSAAVRNISTDVAPLSPSSSSSSSSPPPQPKENRSSQDVGFWEEEKEGSDAEEQSAEDMIKRNRYYDEEDSDS